MNLTLDAIVALHQELEALRPDRYELILHPSTYTQHRRKIYEVTGFNCAVGRIQAIEICERDYMPPGFGILRNLKTDECLIVDVARSPAEALVREDSITRAVEESLKK